MKNYIAILFLTVAAISCTKEADIELPQQEEKLVVTCFISPSDTVLTAVVRTSSPKYNYRNSNGSSEVVTNAEITINSDQGSAVFKYDPAFTCYTLSPSAYPVFAGKKYSLAVKTPDGKQTTGSTTVPSDTLPIKYFNLSIAYSSDSTQLDMSATAEVGAISGRNNYVGMFYRQNNFSADTSQQPYVPFENRGYGTFEDDEKQARQSFVFQERQGSYTGDNLKLMFDSLVAEFWAVNCSKEFYLYNRSAQLAANINGNPFGDPVMVYSNMENGLGCFGGYMVTKRLISR